MATRVIGGLHDGASFTPTNGVAARLLFEHQVARLRDQGVKNPRGRLYDEKMRRHQKQRSE